MFFVLVYAIYDQKEFNSNYLYCAIRKDVIVKLDSKYIKFDQVNISESASQNGGVPYLLLLVMSCERSPFIKH